MTFVVPLVILLEATMLFEARHMCAALCTFSIKRKQNAEHNKASSSKNDRLIKKEQYDLQLVFFLLPFFRRLIL